MDIISYLLGKNAGGGGGGNAEAKEVEITSQSQVITPSEGYTSMSSVTVTGVSSNVDNNILSNNIKRGVTILGIMGTYGSEIIPPEAGTLVGLLVGSLPTKTTYVEGDRLDLSGCTILAEYSNGYQYDVTQSCTYTCNDPVTYQDTKIVVSYTDVTTETIDIPITVTGQPVQAPAETKGLWHFDAGTDKNEVNGKGTSTSGLVDPQSQPTSIGVFGTVGCKNSSNMWLSYNNTLGLTNYAVGTIQSSDFTCEFWFYPSSGNALFKLYMSKATNYSTDIGLKIGSGGALSINGSSGWLPSPTLDTTVTAPLNSWHHFAFVNNHTTRKVYIDGKLWATSTANPSTDLGLAYMYMMTNNSSSDFFDEILFTENAKYLANFEPPHAEYYLAGGE